jgi:hypothetical protein
MSGCNCKKDINGVEFKTEDQTFLKKTGGYGIRFFGFLISLFLLPVIIIASIIFMFKTIVLNENVDIKSILMSIIKKGKTDDDDDELEDDEYDYLTEEDVSMVDVEDITIKIK